MIKSLKELFRRLAVSKPRAFQHLQVEVTTRCDMPGCLMCPRRAWPERWLKHDLSWQDFERLIPAFKLFKHVHLSGWGEPLLHPRLWDMARAARSQGCTVSLTTNGMKLTKAMQMQVLEHLDMVAVSLDGATAETFERLRPGADFQRVSQQVAALCARKHALGKRRPEVVLLFMKMKPNIAELPDLLQLAAELGVDRVNATNLDFVSGPTMEGLTLVSPGPDPEITAIFQQAQRQAEISSLPFRNVGSTPVSDLLACDANPLMNVFVTAAGSLSPCVYLGLPVAGTFSRQFFQESYPVHNYFYGNVAAQDFSQILREPDYQEFTTIFHNRVAANSSLLNDLVPNQDNLRPQGNCRKSRLNLAPWSLWPPACQGCYKSLGF
jgi:MoaA/NifB/PqqE/SkfB family radical SAM enzyme